MEVVFGVWFYDLIHLDESLTDEKIKAAVRRVPGLYETWFERRRGDLMAAMKDSPCRASGNVCRYGNDTACPHSYLEFELAAAVFQCSRKCSYLFAIVHSI
jgi:hypothetical protein